MGIIVKRIFEKIWGFLESVLRQDRHWHRPVRFCFFVRFPAAFLIRHGCAVPPSPRGKAWGTWGGDGAVSGSPWVPAPTKGIIGNVGAAIGRPQDRKPVPFLFLSLRLRLTANPPPSSEGGKPLRRDWV